jgi:manganese/zinc/iron transport system permease protein
MRKWISLALVLGLVGFKPSMALAGSLAELSLDWPSWQELLRVLTLHDYNTRVVVVGTTVLGLAAGLIGTFLLLRKRALLSDTLSHATLPGIALAFMMMTYLGGEGKNLLGLIAGAAVFAVLGTGSVVFIQHYSRLKDDAALGVVLSVYFALGIALLGVATRMATGNAAGLNSFIYGKTASMLYFDAVLIGGTALIVAIFCVLLFKELSLLCFDEHYASTQGWPVVRLDFLLMCMVVVVTVVGLQAVGLILVVALLIIPPAAARFWTHKLRVMLGLSGLFGGLSGLFGSAISALMANLPAGAVIVLVAATIFLVSLTFGYSRGLIRQVAEQYRLRAKVARENLLRALYELEEGEKLEGMAEGDSGEQIQGHSLEDLLGRRSWVPGQLRRILRSTKAVGLTRITGRDRYALTKRGIEEAARLVRKHRLWEAYLIAHADIAPSQVDWGADEIEHVLDREMIQELEQMVPEIESGQMPPSPHKLTPMGGTN